MKKSVLILVIVLSAFGILAIELINNEPTPQLVSAKTDTNSTCTTTTGYRLPFLDRNEQDFHYDIGSRFSNTITREQLLKAKTVNDIILHDAMYSIESMWDVELFLHKPGKDWVAKGNDATLTQGQLDIINAIDYSSDYNITALCNRKHNNSGAVMEGYFDHYFTVVPEKEARYEGGKGALRSYLVLNSYSSIGMVDSEQLSPGKVRFVVTEKGSIADVSLEFSCGYEDIDKVMVDIIEKMPQKWTPAENEKGEKVDQEFVFSYGRIGC